MSLDIYKNIRIGNDLYERMCGLHSIENDESKLLDRSQWIFDELRKKYPHDHIEYIIFKTPAPNTWWGAPQTFEHLYILKKCEEIS